jgi:hypothetical protein
MPGEPGRRYNRPMLKAYVPGLFPPLRDRSIDVESRTRTNVCCAFCKEVFRRSRKTRVRLCASCRYRNGMLLSRYGLPLEEYEGMSLEQGRRCKVCRTHEGNGKRERLGSRPLSQDRSGPGVALLPV